MTHRSQLVSAASRAVSNAAASSLAVAGLTFSSLALGYAVIDSMWGHRSYAVTFSDGRIAFNSPPLMVKNSVTPSDAGRRNATYRFSISVPQNAGEPLTFVEILPYAVPNTLYFRMNAISAHTGDSIRGGDPIPVIGYSLDNNPSETRATAVGVQFDPPLLPGQTVTIVLKSLRNPSFGGSYTYSAIAYPALDVGVGHRMGFARFTIHSSGSCNRLGC